MKRPFPLLVGLALMTGGCASFDDSGYPSLERRAVELRGNPAPAPAPDPAPPPVTAEFAAALAALSADAARGDAAFRAALPNAEREIAAARGSAAASEPWFAAQAALSALEQTRAPTLLALSELDRIAIESELAGASERTAPAASAISEVAALEAAQTAVLNRLAGQLAR